MQSTANPSNFAYISFTSKVVIPAPVNSTVEYKIQKNSGATATLLSAFQISNMFATPNGESFNVTRWFVTDLETATEVQPGSAIHAALNLASRTQDMEDIKIDTTHNQEGENKLQFRLWI